MTPAVDASSPARVTGSTTNGTLTVTTATFDPPASTLVVTVQANARPGGATGVISSNGTALTWTTVGERSIATPGGTSHAYAAIFTAVLPASRGGMTVTATLTASSGNATDINVPTIKVYVVTGADPVAPNGASVTGQSVVNNLTTDPFTDVGASSLGFVSASEWVGLGAPTSSDSTLDAFTNGFMSGASGYRPLGGTGSSSTFNLDAPGASAAEWNWVSCEVLAAGVSPPYPGLLVSRLRPYFG